MVYKCLPYKVLNKIAFKIRCKKVDYTQKGKQIYIVSREKTMCDYITATLPAGADLVGLMPIVKRYHLDFTPIPNENVIAQLQPVETYHNATGSKCDCGTGLGSIAAAHETKGESGRAVARKVRKLQSKGWSKTKIDRWLAQNEETQLNRQRVAAHREQWYREQYTSDAERWLGIVSEMLESGKTLSVGLLIHWYSRKLESERIKLKKRCRASIADVSPEFMLQMEHDVLYEFTK